MWLIKVIDFLYFREGRKAINSDHAFSLLEELEHTQLQTVAKQQCDKNRPGDCESFSKFEAYSFSFSKAGVHISTKVGNQSLLNFYSFQESLWGWATLGEIQKKPQKAVCSSNKGDLHQVWYFLKRQNAEYLEKALSDVFSLRQGRISTGSPCPICRDEYLVLDYRWQHDCHGALGSDNNDVDVVDGGGCDGDVDADNHGDYDAGIGLIWLY